HRRPEDGSGSWTKLHSGEHQERCPVFLNGTFLRPGARSPHGATQVFEHLALVLGVVRTSSTRARTDRNHLPADRHAFVVTSFRRSTPARASKPGSLQCERPGTLGASCPPAAGTVLPPGPIPTTGTITSGIWKYIEP